MSEQLPEQDDERLLLHLMVVGFHHKKGCLVEYCYPPLDPSFFQQDISPDESTRSSPSPAPLLDNEKAAEDDKTKQSSVETVSLPSIWQTLPSLAIPDGAHNFDSDTVFFHLPHPADWTKTVFCVSCYRQMATKELLVRTPDMTRSSVQKSVVAILRLPFYGLVEYKVEIVTRAYFEERDFSKRHVLRESFYNINRQLTPSLLDSPELLTGLSVRSLFTRFGSQVIVLFKLLLLEKKSIFIMSPIRELTATILTLCSLIPGLVQEGLVHSVIPFNVKSSGVNVILNRIQPSESTLATSCDNSGSTQVSQKVTSIVASPTQKVSSEMTTVDSLKTESSIAQNESQSSFSSAIIDPIDPQFPDESEEEAQKRLATIISRPHMYYGLPLQIFTCSSYLLPYFSISYFDVLINERVRSCIAGSSNQIFKRWENDIDVFVLDNQIEIDDVQLKRILKPTAEDMNFMSYLIKSIVDNTDPFGNTDIFDESQHVFYEGSDEWIRCHFKNYLLHMMRCSSLDENSQEYRAFGPLYMACWKETHNFKAWSSGPYTAACHRDIDPAHPFSGNRLNNIRFKLANLFLNRQEYINQSLNKQVITNVISNARSTVNSWFSNLGSSINQAKAATSTWNSFISTAVAGPSKLVQPSPASRNGNKNGLSKKSSPKAKEKENFVMCPGKSEDEPKVDETSV